MKTRIRVLAVIIVAVFVFAISLLPSSEREIGWVLSKNREVEAIKVIRGLPLPWLIHNRITLIGDVPPEIVHSRYLPRFNEWRPGYSLHYGKLALSIGSSIALSLLFCWFPLSLKRNISSVSPIRNCVTLVGAVLLGVMMSGLAPFLVGFETFPMWQRTILVLSILFFVPALIAALTWKYRCYSVPILVCIIVWLSLFASHHIFTRFMDYGLSFDSQGFVWSCCANVVVLLFIMFFGLEFGKKQKAAPSQSIDEKDMSAEGV